LAERRETGFRSADEVERELRLPYLASLPELTDPRGQRRAGHGRLVLWDYVVAKPASAFAESIRNIRATLMAGGESRPRTICVTSPLTCDGKSVTAVALARVMAMSGDRVLLVDCDLRRSGLAALRGERSGRAPSTGVMEVLEGETDPRKAIVQDVVPGLTFLGSDGPVFSPRDIFSGPRTQEVLNRLKSEYDFVILDAPPVLAVTDAWTISSLCDATLLVARYAKTPREAVHAAADRLRLRGARLHGVVLNRRPAVRRFGKAGDYDSMHAAYYRN
jgi:capsular exopolysaccharide synthesis family protein